MRKDDRDEIQKFIYVHHLEHIRQELFDLCMSINVSGWVDGSNDYIEDYEEEE